MQSKSEIAEQTINLLSSTKLEDVCAKIAELVQKLTGSKFTAIVMWDPDLESFGDHFVFGTNESNAKGVEEFLQAFSEEFHPQAQVITQIKETAFDQSVPKSLQPLICYQIANNEMLSACLLFTYEDKLENLVEFLKPLPFDLALHRAWELRELEKENVRLRNSYEQLEDKTSNLEDETRKLIHDLTAKDTIRTKHVERERLVYLISNVVRSYVDIQKVLETTVEKIGTTFDISRCLLLRTIDQPLSNPAANIAPAELSVFEYIQPSFSSVKDLFSTRDGIAFTIAALQRKTPHDLGDLNGNEQIYDQDFLRKLNIHSGLIIPLVVHERVLGVLFLQDCAGARHWSIDDISLIGSLADQVSVAIENAELHQEKERQAVTDGLTGIANRRHFNEVFAREFERAKRYGQPLSLVLIDLDFLKVMNDSFGHQIGDEAIRETGRMLKQSSRAIDLAARYGGEEFCLLLPNTDIAMAEQLAERLRRLIHEVYIEGPGHISASLGVASFPNHASDPDFLFRKADEALYEAKQAGRNMIKVAAAQSDISSKEKK